MHSANVQKKLEDTADYHAPKIDSQKVPGEEVTSPAIEYAVGTQSRPTSGEKFLHWYMKYTFTTCTLNHHKMMWSS